MPAAAGHERLLPIGVGVVLVAAAIFSVNNVGEARGIVAQPEATPRLEIAGLAEAAAIERKYELEIAELEAASFDNVQAVATGDVAQDPIAAEALLWKPIDRKSVV